MADRLIGYLALPLLLSALVWLATPRTEENGGFDSDGIHYGAMALADARLDELARTAPFCYRVLTPWLARQVAPWLPDEGRTPAHRILAAFTLIAFASNVVTLAALYSILRAAGLHPTARVGGVLLYAGVFWTLKFSYYSPAYVDHQAQMFAVVALALAVRSRYLLLPLWLALAVVQKEATLYVLPAILLHYARAARSSTRTLIGWSVAMTLVPAMARILVQNEIQPVNRYSFASVWLEMLRTQLADPGFWPWLAAAAFSGLGILPVLVLSNAGAAWRFLRQRPHWGALLLCGLPLLFGAYEKARYFLFLLLPLAVVAGVLIHQRFAAGDGWRAWVWLGSAVLAHLYLGHHLEPMGSFEAYLDRMVPIRPEPGVAVAALIRGAGVSATWWLLSWAISTRRDAMPTSAT